MQPVPPRPKLCEHVQGEIERLILSGNIKVNDQLPTEAELAQTFGVSRTVVREAIQRLEAQGLVRVRVGSGSYVVPFDQSQITRAVARFAAMNPQTEVFLEMLDLRLVLEAETADRLGRAPTAETIAKLESAIARMKKHRNDLSALASADMDFHQTIADASGNSFFRVILEPLKKLGHSYGLSTYRSSKVIATTIAEHDRILDAIRAGDGPGARKAMQAHLIGSRERYVELLAAHERKQSRRGKA